ncbi:hypothetical protein FA048_01690 [Pedobacter polaris]|uniref:TonB-dependent receptor plug domain-containing protein n=1 Tax=Pedobacter polaris TaxID=2571273 RepID=A0A4U1CYG6_9SPHI|nr:hypothetical protein [Pedobacter polaris]TKC12358.1 hypothetical protein FA048_01690 [Pedobacter polaris]
MKKLIFSSLIAILLLSSFQKENLTASISVKTDLGLDKFYKHLGNNIMYPSAARSNDIQGNSLILFTVNEGKLKDLKIQSELGSGCDIEALNKILSFSDYKVIKNGNYALKLAFKLQGSTAEFKNNDLKIPEGYKELNITILANAIVAQATGNSFKVKWNSNDDTKFNAFFSSKNSKAGLEKLQIILDGNVIDNATLQRLKPDNIESISVLKDSIPLALYGKEGKQGTILITTKKTALPNIK